MRERLLTLLVCVCVSLAWTPQSSAQNLRSKLLLALVDGRAQGRVSPQSVVDTLTSALGVPVTLASEGGDPGELGVLSVVISNQGALVIWTLSDGRGDTRHVAHGVTAAAIVPRIALAVSDMAQEFSRPSAVAEGDLVDPFRPGARRRLPSPWAQSMMPKHRRRLHLDLVDAFEDPARRNRTALVPVDTVNPWP